jgi:hypothetical protein
MVGQPESVHLQRLPRTGGPAMPYAILVSQEELSKAAPTVPAELDPVVNEHYHIQRHQHKKHIPHQPAHAHRGAATPPPKDSPAPPAARPAPLSWCSCRCWRRWCRAAP